MIDPSEWCFISGLVSAQSERLMDRRTLLGLLEADSPEELRGRLRASLLFTESPPSGNPLDDIEARLEEVVERIAALSPDDRIADLVLMSRRWEELRTFAKRKLQGASGTQPGKPAAKPGPADELLEAAWRGRVEDTRMKPFVEAAEEIQSASEQQEDVPGWVDRLVDAREAATLVAVAAELGGKALTDWVRTYANLCAGLALIRARRIGWEVEPFWEQWKAVGFDDPDLAELAGADETAWPRSLEKLGLPDAARVLSAPDPTVALARRMDDQLANLASAAKGMPFGPELVFAFLWALRSEAVNMKLVLAAAAFGIPEERVAAELRTGYG